MINNFKKIFNKHSHFVEIKHKEKGLHFHISKIAELELEYIVPDIFQSLLEKNI